MQGSAKISTAILFLLLAVSAAVQGQDRSITWMPVPKVTENPGDCRERISYFFEPFTDESHRLPSSTFRGQVESAQIIVRGQVSSTDQGFYYGWAGTNLGIDVREVLMAPDDHPVPSTLHLYYQWADFDWRGKRFCVRDQHDGHQPKLGQEVLLLLTNASVLNGFGEEPKPSGRIFDTEILLALPDDRVTVPRAYRADADLVGFFSLAEVTAWARDVLAGQPTREIVLAADGIQERMSIELRERSSGESPRPSACHGRAVVVDLDGDDDISTVGSHRMPVEFDLDGDGVKETIGWTGPWSTEAFLWLDLDGNRQVDSGRELFGDATRLPNGERAEHGFEALAVYDMPEFGGDGDGSITQNDLVFPHLRLWIDRSHDGISQRDEVYNLRQQGILEISLEYQPIDKRWGNGTRWGYRGVFAKKVDGRARFRVFEVIDVFFPIEHEHDDQEH